MNPTIHPTPEVVPAAAPRPSDEARRLECVRALHVLGTSREAFTDAIAAAAAALANTPISAVSLIDRDRQWMKASCGLDVREIDRDVTLCAYTVLDTRPLVVPDTRLDPRFASNPLVLGEPYVRFYAGFPLVVQGQPVGALCVIDDRPRRLSDAQTAQLADLADGVAAWLHQRSAGDA